MAIKDYIGAGRMDDWDAYFEVDDKLESSEFAPQPIPATSFYTYKECWRLYFSMNQLSRIVRIAREAGVPIRIISRVKDEIVYRSDIHKT